MGRPGCNGHGVSRLGTEHPARPRDQPGQHPGRRRRWGGVGGGGGGGGGGGWGGGGGAGRGGGGGGAGGRRRWFLPDTGRGGRSASAERTTSHSANRPSRLGPRTASATKPIKRSSAAVVARVTRRGAPPRRPPLPE